MRVTFAGASRLPARAAAAGVCADVCDGAPANNAPTTPLNDFAKSLRSTAISPPDRVTAATGGALYARLVAFNNAHSHVNYAKCHSAAPAVQTGLKSGPPALVQALRHRRASRCPRRTSDARDVRFWRRHSAGDPTLKIGQTRMRSIRPRSYSTTRSNDGRGPSKVNAV